jgi:hypothetical protein
MSNHWFCPTVLAVAAIFAGATGEQKRDKPKPLPATVVKEWKDAGARVGWMKMDVTDYSPYQSHDEGDEREPGELPAFRFRADLQKPLARMPADPGEPFGLEIDCGQLTDEHLKPLVALKSLRMLALVYVEVTGEDLKELAGLKDLRLLSLHSTGLTDAGLREVAAFSRLQMLYIRGADVTDAGLKELARLKGLQQLNVERTKVTAAGVAALKKSLPKCQILHGRDLPK